jgi:hypothetical protein
MQSSHSLTGHRIIEMGAIDRAGYVSTQVVALRQIPELPQARHPSKLRTIHFRHLEFAVPQLPRWHAAERGAPAQPPPARGADSAAKLESTGIDEAECGHLIESSAAQRRHRKHSPGLWVRR